jgi:hypothetical protein
MKSPIGNPSILVGSINPHKGVDCAAACQIHAVPDAADRGSGDGVHPGDADALVAAGLQKVPNTGALMGRDHCAGIVWLIDVIQT